jgi:D-arabinose 1-dehydrogenase-like Zn-dependent alcohol dehydrogenase
MQLKVSGQMDVVPHKIIEHLYVAKGKVRVTTEIFPLEEISNVYDKVADGNVRFLCSCDDCIFGIFVK